MDRNKLIKVHHIVLIRKHLISIPSRLFIAATRIGGNKFAANKTVDSTPLTAQKGPRRTHLPQTRRRMAIDWRGKPDAKHVNT